MKQVSSFFATRPGQLRRSVPILLALTQTWAHACSGDGGLTLPLPHPPSPAVLVIRSRHIPNGRRGLVVSTDAPSRPPVQCVGVDPRINGTLTCDQNTYPPQFFAGYHEHAQRWRRQSDWCRLDTPTLQYPLWTIFIFWPQDPRVTSCRCTVWPHARYKRVSRRRIRRSR